VDFVTRLGTDAFAAIARDIWGKAGVQAAVREDPDSYTGAAFIFLQQGSGQNAIIVSPGAAGRITAADVEAEGARFRSARLVMTQLEQPVEAARRALELGREGGAITVLNPAPAAPLPDGLLALCDLVSPNESEAEALTGIPVTGPETAAAAAARLLEMGARAAVVTLGAQGALYRDGARTLHVPPLAAGPVVDTTGAGDAFNGGLAVALAEGRGIDQALRMATATAALKITRLGTAAAMPTRAEIDTLLAKG
jgi:ribokinase